MYIYIYIYIYIYTICAYKLVLSEKKKVTLYIPYRVLRKFSQGQSLY